MAGSDGGGGNKGGLFSQPSSVSLDDLMGPDQTESSASAMDAPDPETMARFVPFKVDVSETGEGSSVSELPPIVDEPEPAPALVQFVAESATGKVSEFSSSQNPDAHSSVPPTTLLPRDAEAMALAPEPQLLARLRFPKPEPTEDRGLTPLVRPTSDEPDDGAQTQPQEDDAPPTQSESEAQPDPAPDPLPEATPPAPAAPQPEPAARVVPDPSEVLAEPVSSLPPELDGDPADASTEAADGPLQRIETLEEAEWTDALAPPPKPPLRAQVEAVMSSDPVAVSQPPPLAARPMVPPPPRSEPLHPMLYVLLVVFGLAAILAFAIPML